MDTLKIKKAWEVAIAPAKSLPMSAIGMYMAGNTLQIFSIFMLFTLFKTPLQALMNISAQFGRFESEGTRSRMFLVKVVYTLTNFLALAMGIWKVNQMGLLPSVSLPTYLWSLVKGVATDTLAAPHGRIGWHGKHSGFRLKEHIGYLIRRSEYLDMKNMQLQAFPFRPHLLLLPCCELR